MKRKAIIVANFFLTLPGQLVFGLGLLLLVLGWWAMGQRVKRLRPLLAGMICIFVGHEVECFHRAPSDDCPKSSGEDTVNEPPSQETRSQ